MTQHDKISAFIDNELSQDAEQDFLISLASNEGVRKAFRSELILKNVIHQDERATRPKREMRGVIFGAIGASTLVASESGAAATGLKAFFAGKVNALLTAGIITVSAAGGYVANEVIHHSAANAPTVIVREVPVQSAPMQQAVENPAEQTTDRVVTNIPQNAASRTPKQAPLQQQRTGSVNAPSQTTVMPGLMETKTLIERPVK